MTCLVDSTDRLLTERSDAGSQLTSALRHVSDTLTRRGAQLHATQVTRDTAASRRMSDVERQCAENKVGGGSGRGGGGTYLTDSSIGV